jgi:Histidine phosphatase superfamily (branch 2)
MVELHSPIVRTPAIVLAKATSTPGGKEKGLDEMNSTFPLNQTLYFDFSHDTNIMSIITAFATWLFQSVSANKWPACKSATHCVSYGALQSQHGIRNYQDTSIPQNNSSCQLNHGEDVRLLHRQQPYHLHSPSPQPADRPAG